MQKYSKNIGEVYEEGTVSYQTCQKWFAKFHAKDFLWMILYNLVDQWK